MVQLRTGDQRVEPVAPELRDRGVEIASFADRRYEHAIDVTRFKRLLDRPKHERLAADGQQVLVGNPARAAARRNDRNGAQRTPSVNSSSTRSTGQLCRP